MKKSITTLMILIAAMATGVTALPHQDHEEAARAEAAAVRAQQAREAREERELKARNEWFDTQGKTSEQRLASAEKTAAEKKVRENETKFTALQKSARELLELSESLNRQLDASGPQTVSISFFSDLERIEQAVKNLRKHAK
jgi:LmbE family N-acetylglucosaminyl deacetylase